MGGKLSVESIENEGSTFSFSVEMADLGAKTEVDESRLQALRVLVVDDNATHRSAVTSMLQQLRIETFAFDSADALLRAPQLERVDLVLTDISMPAIDGNQLAAELRRHNGSTPRLVAMTSLDHGAVETSYFSSSLRKPVRPSELAAALKTAIGAQGDRRHPRRETQLRDFRGLKLTVLVAEDNLVNQKVAKQMLSKLGVEADVVNDGREALQQLAHTRYALVFMDMQMPEVDGVEATRLLRLDKSLSQPYIIAMTANAREEDRRLCIDAGMNDFVSKPVTIDDLRNVLERAQQAGAFEAKLEPSAAVQTAV